MLIFPFRQCRRPDIDELWKSRHPPTTGPHRPAFKVSDKKDLQRTILTLGLTRDTQGAAMSVESSRRLSTLLFDYIMLVCIDCIQRQSGMKEVAHQFPRHKEDSVTRADVLKQVQERERANLPAQSDAQSDAQAGSIPAETRAIINASQFRRWTRQDWRIQQGEGRY